MKLISSIGLMSGTSMDSIDGSLIYSNGRDITENHFSISGSYQKKTMDLLEKFISKFSEHNYRKEDWKLLNTLVAQDHANVIKKIIHYSNVKPDVIGFHGQTVYHNPKRKISIQIGDTSFLKRQFSTTIVSNFRSSDLQNGGEGAPLAPIYHKSIIEKLNLNLPACFVNIGGVSNLTYWDGKNLIGFDTGPGNGLMDQYIKKYLNKDYDENGVLASKGKASDYFLQKFIKQKYFLQPFPKSLDNFYFSNFLNITDFKKLSIEDSLATLSLITIRTILDSIKKLPQIPKTVTIMGGGQFNKHLVQKFIESCSIKTLLATQLNLNAKMIEPELIGYLAIRKILNLPSTFPSTTGVVSPNICGEIFK